MPKIFIGGDSWGCGEWSRSPPPYSVKHLGLEQYFIDDNYSVVNSSIGGSSNHESITRLEHSLSAYSNNDVILWIQTDPIRDVEVDNISNLFNNNSFTELENQLLYESYSKLQKIGKKFNTTIFLIGGCRNINSTLASTFNNLNVLTASWVALLINQYEGENFGFDAAGKIDDFNINSMPFTIRAKLVDDITQYRPYILYKHEIFQPDGAHPNRSGHKILYNYIKKKLNL